MKNVPYQQILFVIFAVFGVETVAFPQTNAPYYYGTYNPSSDATNNPPPDNQPPPVVYRRVPVYRPVYRAPAWASPSAAALGPWPWNFDFGGGPTIVSGSDGQMKGGSNFIVGGGYNFSPRVGFVLEFANNWLGVTNQALTQNGAFDGDANVWSFTVNPIYRFRLGGPFGAYVIGGGGYYQRELRFFEEQTIIDPFFGPIPATVEVRNTDDTGGVNVGAGLTWNWGWGTKFFVEARYHYVFTSGNATQIIPITFGFRW
jgi:hypothetical protein